MCTGFFLGVKRIGRRLLYGSGFHAAQRSSAWSLALQLAGASMQNATDRTGEGSEHPSTENNSDSTKLFQEPSHSKSTEHPRGGAKWLVSWTVVIYYQREDWIESDPLIVTGLSHWGKASVPTSKILLFQHKVKNDLLFGCFSKKVLTTGSPRDHWVSVRVWCSQ